MRRELKYARAAAAGAQLRIPHRPRPLCPRLALRRPDLAAQIRKLAATDTCDQLEQMRCA